MNTFFAAIAVIDGILVICGAVALIVKPLRQKLFKDKESRDGIMCLLRSQMLNTYYDKKDEGKIREYEYKNFMACYHAYKAMGGNSFIDHVKPEVDEFDIER